MAKDQSFMKDRPVLPLLLSMAVPMMLSMLIQSLYNIVDSIFVSYLGTNALTAVSLVFPLQNLMLAVSLGAGIGVSSLIARSLGEGNRKSADLAAATGVWLSILHSLAFVGVGLFAAKPFLRIFTADPDVLGQAEGYAAIILCFAFGNLLQIMMEKIFQALGEMLITMLLLASGCIINVILDPILIFGLFGAPAMGVRGAAIATVIGQTVAFLLYVVIFRCKEIGIRIPLLHTRLDGAMVKKIYAVGIPSAIMVALPSLLISLLNGMLVRFSEIYVAVLGVYYKLQTFIYMPANGIVQGMRPLVSYNYGAREKGRLKAVVFHSMVLSALVMAAGTAAAQLAPQWILGLFHADASLLEAGVPALRIISLGFLASTVSIICCGFFEALGKGMESLIISVLRQFIVIIALGLLLSRFWGPTGIWAAFPIAELTGAVAAIFLYRRAWKAL